MTKDEEKKRFKEWYARRQEAEFVIQKMRLEEAKSRTTAELIYSMELLAKSFWKDRPLPSTSGLVEMQRRLAKAR